ncbi:MAG: TetR/AcrR family transcriptional regulator [Saccharopolyspora sp.]|uniref:TetR/AcrR family transcriptional regulator n=1 Tax=Saccharopolyspora TaxID=1835 RepID=UPI00190C5947|nr:MULTISPECIES: TetR/AcrR family transcriptional regulator [unclassified Saccharopolyspora]MBK0870461.1 TetR/AcrR family transcriptional regulator [Saccharopolyspora sp. HNM0986]MBQ6640031.1 TetR/AcrR family transcriptional regulator [Saccharopolyspora sp.]
MNAQHATSTTNGPRKRLPRAEREQQILAVAEEVFAGSGYQASSMDDIAQRVGLSKPMLYEYFGSKEGLLIACVERARRELLDATTVAAANAADNETLLHDCLLAFFRFSDDHAQAWALLRSEAAIPSASVDSAVEETRAQQTGLTARLLEASRPDLDPERLEAFAESIIGACERLALWRERSTEITAERATQHLMALISPSLVPPA